MIKTELNIIQNEASTKLLPKQVGALFMRMGKGKSLVILNLFYQRLKQKKVNKMFIFLPLSTRENFQKEIFKHYNGDVSAISLYGIESISMSDRIYNTIAKKIDDKTFLVFDESTKVKNCLAIRTERAYQLSKLCKYKLISTGTPVTKYIKDLYAQFLILSPNILGYKNYEAFKENHLQINRVTGEVVGSANYDYLKTLIEPFTYFSLEESENEIKKCYEKIEYSPKKETHLLYEKIKFQAIEKYSTNSANSIVIMGMLTSLHAAIHDENRMDALIKIIEKTNTDNQIIIVCRYTKSIHFIHQALESSSVILNGENKQINAFLNGGKRILIANIACGSLGLNLQNANVIIFYENQFDYYLRLQAEARIARSGQKKNCIFYDLNGGFGIEKMIFKSLEKKKNLLEEFKNFKIEDL